MSRKLKAYKMSEEMFLDKLGIDMHSESTASVDYNIHNGIVTVYTTGSYVAEIVEGGDVPFQLPTYDGLWQER